MPSCFVTAVGGFMVSSREELPYISLLGLPRIKSRRTYVKSLMLCKDLSIGDF